MTGQHVLNVNKKRKFLSKILLSKQLRVLGHWLRRPPETTIKKYAHKLQIKEAAEEVDHVLHM